MDSSRSRRDTALLLAAALLITAWGVGGFVDRLQKGWGAYTYSPEYVINYVRSGGAGEEAGLEVGDRVVTVDGIPVESLPLYSRWPRSLAVGPGETLRLVVERRAEALTVDVTYREIPQSTVRLRLGGMAVALSFLWFGIWPALTVSTGSARVLAGIGVAAGLGMLGPYLGTWDGVATHLGLAATMLWLALILWFFLTYPRVKRLAEHRVMAWLVFGSWALFLPFLIVELVFHPRYYHSFGGVGTTLMLVYVALAAAAVIHTLIAVPWREIRDSGMGIVLAGLFVGLVPSFLDPIVGMLFEVTLPGSRYFPLLILVIPVTLALGVRRHWHPSGGDRET